MDWDIDFLFGAWTVHFSSIMGQKLATPLSLTLDHWSEVKSRAKELAFPVKKGKWRSSVQQSGPFLSMDGRLRDHSIVN